MVNTEEAGRIRDQHSSSCCRNLNWVKHDLGDAGNLQGRWMLLLVSSHARDLHALAVITPSIGQAWYG